MRRTLTLAGIVLAAFGGTLAHASAAAGKRGKQRSAEPRLTAFPGCKPVKRYALRHPGALPASLPFTDDSAGIKRKKEAATSPEGDGAGAGGGESSGTNVQEEGIDEPDLVKTEGDRLFVVSGSRLVAMETGPGAPRELGAIELGGSGRTFGSQLLLRGGRALVLTPGYNGVLIRQVEVSDPSAMRVTASMRAPGTLVDARRHDGIARVVVSGSLRSAGGLEEAVRRAKPRALVPRARLWMGGKRKVRPLVACSSIRRPASFSGLGLVTVLTIDLDRGLPAVDSDAVLMGGETVYASDEGLYVATQRHRRFGLGGPTEIHRFGISGPATAYEASGRVPGQMLNQFSMSEHEGVLRVASTTDGNRRRGRRGQSFVTTLAQSGGELVQVGQVGGLGPGERIYAVRFLGDTGYVVTFRQTDPLYTLDLSVPSAPVVLGELKVAGYSAYLHPLPNGRLLGVGQDATDEGRALGTQVSLFDVSNLAAPSLMSRAVLGGDSSSDAEFDHHAFLFWEPRQLAVIPVTIASRATGRPSFAGAVAFRTDGAVAEVARLTHGDGAAATPISRAIVNSGRLVTVSDGGVMVSDLDSFSTIGWVPTTVPASTSPKRKAAKKKR